MYDDDDCVGLTIHYHSRRVHWQPELIKGSKMPISVDICANKGASDGRTDVSKSSKIAQLSILETPIGASTESRAYLPLCAAHSPLQSCMQSRLSYTRHFVGSINTPTASLIQFLNQSSCFELNPPVMPVCPATHVVSRCFRGGFRLETSKHVVND